MIGRLIALALTAAIVPAAAQDAPAPQSAAPVADPSLTARSGELIAILNGGGDYQGYFTPAFHAALPREKWDAVVAQIFGQLGKPVAIESTRVASPFSAYLRVRFAGGVVNAQISVDPASPHQVSGILFTGVEVAGDNLDRLAADVRALPGNGSIGIYVLGKGAPRLISGVDPDKAVPLGSAFKLWVLGELTREVAAGERKWADVVPVGPPSLPSGMTQAWPAASPVTIQTLATLMISISDNTATDTLVTLEGAKLDTFVTNAGASGLAPIMTTRQMFAIKSASNAAIAAKWAASQSPSARRKLLDDNARALASTPVNAAIFGGKPVAIDTLEWFASPAQTAGMLDWFRTTGGDTSLALLGINPGVDAATRARFDYVGFKGGSEPGVITLNFLVRRKDGRWLAIAAGWHRSDALVETLKFTGLLTRALVLAADARLD